ncbi:MAG: cobalamin biosynthesis protein CbiG [Pseudomonadota bacterium]
MGEARLFDAVLMVDWSAAAVPRRGRDSIWIAEVAVGGGAARLANAPTRLEAMALVERRLDAAATAGERLLIGFDFPFGYPAGSVARLAAGRGAAWAVLWALMREGIVEGARNANNRMALAGRLNARFAPGPGPYWGNASTRDVEGVGRRKPDYAAVGVAELRAVERAMMAEVGGRPSSCWQLAGNPTVGGQAMTGIAALARLRAKRGAQVVVWPFETGLAAPCPAPGQAVLAEVYPSLIRDAVKAAARPGEIADRAQVRVLARAMARLDAAGALAPLFAGAAGLDPATRRAVEAGEAWVLGAGHAAVLAAAAG